MVHIENLQWPARNLVRIGLHGSLTNKYATRLTRIPPKSMPDRGRLPRLCGAWVTPPHARPTCIRVRTPMLAHVGPTLDG